VDALPKTDYADSLSFLLSQIGARSAQLFSARLEPLGIAPRAFAVLSNLALGAEQNQQQLADALGIHRNNMVSLIDEMEAAGLVRRHRSDKDRRAFEVRPTARGRSVVARVSRLIGDLDEELGRGLSGPERVTLVELLKRQAQALGLRPGLHPHLSARPR
jgi:DNA-binding MarR family transcriptional regulator